MTEIATLAIVFVAIVIVSLAFTVGALLVQRVMGQLSAERLPAPVEAVVDTIETSPDSDPVDPRGGVY
ncbi:hypothetical protein [Halomarina litorea]|uniref:hypothetical protein n=1 Tax=Halomarina litorea TaxID=2961595 RepID=UPI0020C54713|nr:hypothetical protein [Halomarina sp. BCD28]